MALTAYHVSMEVMQGSDSEVLTDEALRRVLPLLEKLMAFLPFWARWGVRALLGAVADYLRSKGGGVYGDLG